MVDCEKIIKRDAFLKAIEVDDAPSVAEGLDIDNMILESGYDGAELGDKMTLDFIEDMIEVVRVECCIPRRASSMIIWGGALSHLQQVVCLRFLNNTSNQ